MPREPLHPSIRILPQVALFAGLFSFLLTFYVPYSHSPDFVVHRDIIDPYMNGTFYLPHPAFHVSVYLLSRLTTWSYFTSMAFISALCISTTVWLTGYLLWWIVRLPMQAVFYSLVAVCLSIVTAIFVPGYSRYIYLGQWSPNVWHSPTMVMLQGVALVSFMSLVYYTTKADHTSRSVPIVVCVSTFISVLVKPSYAICLLPAIGMYLLVFRFRDSNLRKSLLMMLLPSVLLLLYQFVKTYLSQSNNSYHDQIILTSFGVFRLYTQHIVTSTLLVLAFPLFVTAVAYKQGQCNNKYLLLAWIMTLVGFCEASFLAERTRFSQANFVFGYIACLHLLFVASMIEYLSWFRADSVTVKTTWPKFVAGAVFSLHLISGLFYFIVIEEGKIFF